jgi:hypothetical protein
MKLNDRNLVIPAAAVTALLAATTILGAFLLTGEEQRTASFWLSLVSVLVAECAVGMSPRLTAVKDAAGLTPWQFGLMQAPIYYAVAVAGLVALALGGVTWRWLLVGHLLALFSLFVLLLAGRMFGSHIAQVGRAESAGRDQWVSVRDQFAPVQEYLRRLGPVVSPEVLTEAARLEDDLRYAPPLGTPGSRGVEEELQACLQKMPGLLAGGAGADWASLRIELRIARDLVARRMERIANSRSEYR